MEARHVREIAEAFALLSGDMRDWPLRCAACGSESVRVDHERDVLVCRCGQMTTRHVAMEDQRERARAHVAGGVGGPLVAWAEARDA